jgi:polygalacturonase
LRVGEHEGDLLGTDDKVLQAGIDYLHRLGGGTLHILPGQYTMRNALYLRSGVRLCGSGEETVLKKAPSVCSSLICDTDWYETQVQVEDATGFTPGCGIALRSMHSGSLQVIKDTVTAVEGNTLHLSRRLEKNAWLTEEATAATLFPILTAEWVDDVEIENLVLDGNRAHNAELNGNYVGNLFIQHCDRYKLRHVIARNYNGDGFSFQVCDDIRFEHCRSENNANLGFHPGSGSQRPVFLDCAARGNSQGIFFCWGVTHGLAQNCTLSDNLAYGSSIGHRDTDNRLVGCTIENNGETGVLFRMPESEYRGAHRNTIENCLIRDNGYLADGVGIEFRGAAHDVILRNNRFEDCGTGKQKIGVRISAEAQGTIIEGNAYTGMVEDIVQQQLAAATQ